MQTAAAIVILTALFHGMPGNKKTLPPPAPATQTAAIQVEEAAPTLVLSEPARSEPVPMAPDADVARRIHAFAQTRVPKNAVSEDELLYIAQRIVVYADRHKVEPELLAGLIAKESRFNPMAVSPSKARGLCQLSPGTAWRQGVRDPFDIDQNLNGGAKYLGEMMAKWNGRSNRLDLALASYLVGPGTVERANGKVPTAHAERYIREIKELRDQIARVNPK